MVGLNVDGSVEMNGQDDANDIVDELLQRELNPIVDQQLQELGFIDLCKK